MCQRSSNPGAISSDNCAAIWFMEVKYFLSRATTKSHILYPTTAGKSVNDTNPVPQVNAHLTG